MGLLLGDIVPDFTQDSTEGSIRFHEWIGDQWAVLFSHPKDFTPVCTTELGQVARMKGEFDQRGVKVVAVSVDSVDAHRRWIGDIEATQGVTMNFPILADEDKTVATAYQMIHPNSDPALTVRSVFIIDNNKKLRASITYPPPTGRHFGEILRAIDSLQLTDGYKVATPANWNDGDDCIILPSITDKEDIERLFPKGHEEQRPYLRTTPQPNK
ncbi:MAG: peroxiredoxin [Acidobacteriota bacterium]|nr:peroxiredoxin [Acidobacteriota bacterium]MDH3784345.1 peroxiredoxin [Acidobacteriota bacterium]